MTLGPVQLISDVLQGCEQLMLQSKVQFVLTHAHPKAPGALDADAYRSTRIGEDRLIPVSRPDAQGGARHRLEDGKAADVPVLQYGQESGLGRIVRVVLGQRLERAAVTVVFTAHLASVLRTMVLDGRGLAWLPRTLIEDDLREGRIVKAASPDWEIPLEIRLYRERELVGRAAEALWASAAVSDAEATH